MAEKSIFDEAREADVTEEIEDEEEQIQDVETNIANLSPKELAKKKEENLKKYGVKTQADGRILTIKGWKITAPKTKDSLGNEIKPKDSTKGTSRFYAGKLAIQFVEDNLIEYYPSIKYFVDDDDKINRNVKVFRTGDNAIAKLFELAVPLMKKEKDVALPFLA